MADEDKTKRTAAAAYEGMLRLVHELTEIGAIDTAAATRIVDAMARAAEGSDKAAG